MKHFKHGKTKTPFKYNTWPWKARLPCGELETQQFSMLQLPEEPNVLDKRESDCPTQAACLAGLPGCQGKLGERCTEEKRGKRKSPQPANQMPRRCPGCKRRAYYYSPQASIHLLFSFYRNVTLPAPTLLSENREDTKL